jgi:hypothetical protein
VVVCELFTRPLEGLGVVSVNAQQLPTHSEEKRPEYAITGKISEWRSVWMNHNLRDIQKEGESARTSIHRERVLYNGIVKLRPLFDIRNSLGDSTSKIFGHKDPL